MYIIKSGIKEWSAVVDALGSARQTIIVRSYRPSDKMFLLYPTFSFYSTKAQSLAKFFQPEFLEAASKSGKIAADRAKLQSAVDIRYFATVVDTVPLSTTAQLDCLEKFTVWSKEHLRAYKTGSKSGKCFAWLLRIHKLAEQITVRRIAQGGPPNFYIPPKAIEVQDLSPVMNDEEFEKASQQILDALNKAKVTA